MSPRARAWLIRGLVALAIVLACAGGGLFWVAQTESGARWVVKQLGSALPGELRIGTFAGPVRGPIHMHRVHYEAETFELTIADARMDWQLRELAHRRFDILWLRGDSVTVRLKHPAERAREENAEKMPDVDLPIDILVGDARFTNVAIYGADSTAAPLIADELTLDRLAFKDTLGVQRVEMHGPQLTLVVHGTVHPKGRYPVALETQWTWRSLTGPPVSGAGTLAGELDSLIVDQTVSAPFTGRVNGLFRRQGRANGFDGRATFAGLRPRAWGATLPEGIWAGDVHGSGTTLAFNADGRFSSREASWGPVDGTFAVARPDTGHWIVDRLDLSVPGTPTRLSAHGRIATHGGSPFADLDAEWSHLTWPTRGPSSWSSEHGDAHVTGTLDRYHLLADADIVIADRPPGRWHLEGVGDQLGIDLAHAKVGIWGGAVDAVGRVNWSPSGTWDLMVRGDSLRSGDFAPDWPGVVAFRAHSAGRLPRSGPQGTVKLDTLRGVVRGSPVAATGTMQFTPGQYRIAEARALWGPDSLTAAGLLGRRWDLAWNVNAPNLGAVLPQGGGTLHGRGRISGPAASLRWEAEVGGDSIVFGTSRVEKLALVADLDPAREMKLDLHAWDLDQEGRHLDSVGVVSRGPRARQAVNAWAVNGPDRLDLAAALSGRLREWNGQVERLDLQSHAAGSWSLAGPAPIRSSGGATTVSDACWVSGGSRVCADLAYGPKGAWGVDGTARDLPLGLFGTFFPPGMKVNGAVNGTAHLKGDAEGTVAGEVDLQPGPGEIRYRTTERDSANTPFERGTLRARFGPEGMNGTLAIRFPGAGDLDLDARLPGFSVKRPPAEQPLAGRLRADFTDLTVVQAFYYGLENTAGHLHADLTLGGTLAAPLPAGDLQLTGGRAFLADRGVDLRDIEIRANRTGAGAATFHATAKSGEGALALEGSANLAGIAGARAHATLKGDRFTVMNTHDIQMEVSPDLTFDVDDRSIRIDGDVRIPSADVGMPDPKKAVVPRSRDVVVVRRSEEQPLRAPSRELTTRIRIVVGDKVHLKGFGFDGHPEGTVLAIDEPGLPMRGTGELHVRDGTYEIYGRRLDVERGRLIFGGPIDNPGVDLRASRSSGDGVTAGFEVKGTVQRPEFRIFSNPAMGQSQTLSYILFGRPLQNVSSGQGTEATRVASALEVPAGNALMSQIVPSGLGLDEARLTSESGQLGDAAVALGKQFSSKLYLYYSVGLVDPVSTLKLRYTMSRMWELGAEVAQRETRGDVRYNVEW